MATQEQIDATYNYMDEIFRLSLGECAALSGALYNGDYTKTLEQAQRDKDEYILKNVRFKPGFRVLDIGCGWGGFLQAVKERGGHGVGLTLSTKQAAACTRNGLEAYVRDWRDIDIGTFGTFDAVVSLEALEHFCSREDYFAGRQEDIYRRFFKLCHDLLPPGGRMYLQTMVRGKNAPDYGEVSVNAPKGSDAYLLAVLEKFYPGSWPAWGPDQLASVSAPYFKAVSCNSGREDYIETMRQWEKRTYRFSFTKLRKAFGLARWLIDKDFRYRLEELFGSYNKECFRREILDLPRMVFERV